MRTKFLVYGVVLATVVLAGLGCVPKQNGLVYFNDFEAIKGWAPVYLNKQPHHSGEYSNKLDSASIYGATFKLRFKEISDLPVRKVKISFWVLKTNENDSSKFVVEVSDKDKNKVFWIAKSIEELVKTPKKWVKVSLEFAFLKENITQPDNVISIYAWNLGKSEIYIDDEKIEFVI
jgi:hypothetical protein